MKRVSGEDGKRVSWWKTKTLRSYQEGLSVSATHPLTI